MPTLRVRDLDIYYERQGAGSRLLFIGGSGGDLRHRPNVFAGPLAREFDVLAYDQRGLGRTTIPTRDYSMAEYADDAAGLLDAIGWSRCLVMGVSFGGMVAQELVLRHPERVERLVLACTSSGGAGGASYPLHELADLEPLEQARRGVELSDRRCDAAWQRDHHDAFERMVEYSLARQRSPTTGEPLSPEAKAGARRQLEARRHHDTWDRLSTIEVPTYLCGGRHDGTAPPENMEAMHRRIPNSKLEFFEGGHLFFMQDRSAFPRIIDFLRNQE